MESDSLYPIAAEIQEDALDQSPHPRPATIVQAFSRGTLRLLKLVGLLALPLVGLAFYLSPLRASLNLLLVMFYFISLGLGGTLFVAIEYATGSKWSVPLRRLAEGLAATLFYGTLLVAALLVVSPVLYPWIRHSQAEVAFRNFWLSWPFFTGRSLFYLGVWLLFTWALLRNSRAQDRDGDPARTRRNIRLSGAFIVVFGLTYWLASYDWIMSLEPRWYSTMFGIYCFSGLFVSALAAITLLVCAFRNTDPLSELLTPERTHDLGKLLFAFTTFWMYIWFSQYMLIWYTDIPEEAGYFVRRLQGPWGPLFLLDVTLNWVLPFAILLPSWTKKDPRILSKVCIIVLAGHWLDLYLMIFPPFSGGALWLGIWEVAFSAAGIVLFCLVLNRSLAVAPLVPLRDPFLSESPHSKQG